MTLTNMFMFEERVRIFISINSEKNVSKLAYNTEISYGYYIKILERMVEMGFIKEIYAFKGKNNKILFTDKKFSHYKCYRRIKRGRFFDYTEKGNEIKEGLKAIIECLEK